LILSVSRFSLFIKDMYYERDRESRPVPMSKQGSANCEGRGVYESSRENQVKFTCSKMNLFIGL
jgi:hypothetical protein